jgi:hypothetical protein
LRDQVEKPCGEDEGGGSTEEKHPRRMPHMPLSTLFAGEEDWDEEAPDTVEKERDERRQRFRGLNAPGHTPIWTLSGPVGLCPARTLRSEQIAELELFGKLSFNQIRLRILLLQEILDQHLR